MRDKLEENGNGLPEFDLDLVTAFLVKEKISPRGMEAKLYAIEQGYLVEENEEKTDIDTEKPSQMRENDTKNLTNEGKPNFPSLMVKNVYELLKQNPKIKYSQMEDNLGVDESSNSLRMSKVQYQLEIENAPQTPERHFRAVRKAPIFIVFP